MKLIRLLAASLLALALGLAQASATISTTQSSVVDQGNGVTTSFSYGFLIPNAGDVIVTFTDTNGAQTILSPTQYTITGLGVVTGGAVTYPLAGSPIASGTTLTIQRQLPLVQSTSVSKQGPTFAAIENALDQQTMIAQQLSGSAITGPVVSPTAMPWAAASGTSDAIAATYSPAISSLSDGLMLGFRASAANVSTTPTFAPNGLTAHTITKLGGQALAVGDIPGINAEIMLRYNLAATHWEMLNQSKAAASSIANAQLATMAADTIKGNNTLSSANPADLTESQAAQLIALRSYLAGLTLSNDGTSPNTVLDIAAGQASDSSNAVAITLGAFTKGISGAWTAGSGNNGMGQGLTATASTWYDTCLANNSGSPDIFFDTAVSGQTPCAQHRPNAIVDTEVRRLGSFKLDGSVHILAFTQNADEFLWAAAVGDLNTSSLSTVATLETLASVPPGVKVIARLRAEASNSSAYAVLLNSPDENSTSTASPAGNASLQNAATVASAGQFDIRTNTSQQIRAVASLSSTTLQIATYGWIDNRGRLN